MSAVELFFVSMKGGTGSGRGGFFNVVTPPCIRQTHELDLIVVCYPQSSSNTAIATFSFPDKSTAFLIETLLFIY